MSNLSLNLIDVNTATPSISAGNSKTGKIPAFSLTPGVSCSRWACEHCHVNGCYAMKSYRMYKNVRNAWDTNTALALFNLDRLEEELNKYFDKLTAPRFFRIHVAGDFITRAYAEMWFRIIKNHPGTKFLAFTKQFDIVRAIPFNELDNMSLVLSAWEDLKIPADLSALYAIAYCVCKGEERPTNAIECPGHCDACGACWALAKLHTNVAFDKH